MAKIFNRQNNLMKPQVPVLIGLPFVPGFNILKIDLMVIQSVLIVKFLAEIIFNIQHFYNNKLF